MESFIAVHGLSWLWRLESVVVALGPSCSKACEILVPPQNIDPASPTLQGAFLATREVLALFLKRELSRTDLMPDAFFH